MKKYIFNQQNEPEPQPEPNSRQKKPDSSVVE